MNLASLSLTSSIGGQGVCFALSFADFTTLLAACNIFSWSSYSFANPIKALREEMVPKMLLLDSNLSQLIQPRSKICLIDILFKIKCHPIVAHHGCNGSVDAWAMLCNCILYLCFAKGNCPSFSLSFIYIMSTIPIYGVLGIISSLSFLVFVHLGFLLALTSSILVALLQDGRVVHQKASRTKGSNP